MTKTLTEQWKDGKLPVGSYYINLVGDVERVDFFEGLVWERTKDFGIEEVLAPVPSYDEHKRLKKKLEIALSVLGQIAMFSSDKVDAVQCAKAIKEMNEVEK